MSNSILNIRKCSRCNVEPSFIKDGEYYGIRCLMCGFEIMGGNIYEIIPSWNKLSVQIEAEKEREKSCQSATEIISEVRDYICNDYCRYIHEGRDFLSVEDKAYLEENGSLPHCDECPLNRL